MPEETQAPVVETPIAETPATDSGPEQQTGQAEAVVETPAQETPEPAVSTDAPKTEAPVVQEPKPVSRRSAQYRIQQLTEQVRELKKAPAPQEQAEDGTQTDVHPDLSRLVAEEVKRRTDPLFQESSKAADEAEINELFTGDRASERSKYEGKIRDMWKLSQYKDVAAADLYRLATYEDAVNAASQKAIEEYKKAQTEANDSSASGASNTANRTSKGEKTAWDLSEKEFEEQVNKARSTAG